MQSMTVEPDVRMAERAAHFATQDGVVSADGRVVAPLAKLASIKDQMASLRQDERSWNFGRVKSESMTLRMERLPDSGLRSSIDRSSSAEVNDLPEWATDPRTSDNSIRCPHICRQEHASKHRSKKYRNGHLLKILEHKGVCQLPRELNHCGDNDILGRNRLVHVLYRHRVREEPQETPTSFYELALSRQSEIFRH